MKAKEVSLTKNYLEVIRAIDETFYNDPEITIDWYLERYNENHKACILFDGNKGVGYILAVPIRKELYDAITNGVIVNDVNISPNMFTNKSDYYYVCSFVLLKDYRNLGFGRLLLNEFINMLDKQKGRYCALTVSEEGYKFASKYMDFKMNVYKDVNVFVKDNK